jgi:hypothetical protein
MAETKMITMQTATDIALSYREVERAEDLLAKVEADLNKRNVPDLRDAFGRQSGGLQLGVPSGPSSHTLYNVPWNLCAPILRAHIAHHRSRIEALTELARIEISIHQLPGGTDG